LTPPEGSDSTDFITTYQYNTLGQMLKKNNPDEGEVSYKYDPNGNLRFVQDANHKATATNSVNITEDHPSSGSFTINKTGVLNWGIWEFGLSSPDDELTITELKILSSNGQEILSVEIESGERKEGKITITPGEYTYERNVTGWKQNYELDMYLTCQKAFEYTYNKYDALDRLTESGEYEGSISFEEADPSSSFPTADKHPLIINKYDNVNGYAGARNLNGRLAGVTYIDQNTWQEGKTYYSYNDEGLVEWMRQEIPGLGAKEIEYEYDLQGNVTHLAYQPGGGDEFHFWYDYDGLGRLYKIYSNNVDNKSTAMPEAQYSYTAESQVAELNLGGAQSVDYTYTVRSWLDMINNPDNLSESTSGFADDRFGMDINYDTYSISDESWQAQYNGNISQARWKVDGDLISPDEPLYNFQYDNINRLTLAEYDNSQNNGDENSGFDVRDISYDANGNLQLINRYDNGGSLTTIDHEYYTGTNRLKNIDGGGDDYTYDSNGSVITDSKKSITDILYDYRNLPLRLFINSEMLQHVYDANGNRVKKDYNSDYGLYYVQDASGQTIAVYNQEGKALFYNIFGLDLIGKKAVKDELEVNPSENPYPIDVPVVPPGPIGPPNPPIW
jgi:YD repeat-containing protein